MSKRSLALLLSPGLLALATACSNSKSESPASDPSSGKGTIDIFTEARTVKVGDTVSLAAKVENAGAQVSWSIVSGPGSLSSATGDQTEYVATASGQAQIQACAGTPCARVGVKVVSTEGEGDGSGGGGDNGGGGSQPQPPATITVGGRVLNEDGHPVENQSVYVLGDESTLTATDLDGKFTIESVVPPYSLVMTENHLNRVFIYKGLTRPDPVLYVFQQEDQTAVPPRSATLLGATDGGDVPGPASTGDATFLGFASPEVPMGMDLERQNWDAALPAVPGPYDLTVNWNSYAPTTTGTLLATEYEYDLSTKAPTHWWYAVQPGVTLLSQPCDPATGVGCLAGPTLTLMPVEADTTQGTISVPPLYTVLQKNLAFSLQGGAFFPVFWDTTSLAQQGNYYYIAPHVQGASTQVCAVARDTVPAFCDLERQPPNHNTIGCSYSVTCIDALAARTTDAGLRILKAPEPSNPVNGANVVNLNTPFQWSAFDGGVHSVRVVPYCPQGGEASAACATGPSYYIFTDANSVKIPDVRAVTGLALNSAVQYEWYVVGYAPYADMDAFTAGIPKASLLWTDAREYDQIGSNGLGGEIGQYPLPPVANASAAVGISYLFTGCFGGCP